MNLKKIIRLFDRGNVSVCGMRGSGKDMLTANVICRRNLPYISNVNYGGEWIPLDFNDLDCGINTYKNFISGKLNKYCFKYPDGTDVYLSDAGVYFPSQYCSLLDRDFGFLAVYQSLSRHIANANFHYNVQNLERVWNKIREQSDIYIQCKSCKVFFGIVFQKVIIYERYQACVDRVPPFRAKVPFVFSPGERRKMELSVDLAKNSYLCSHGVIKPRFLIYRNKSKYNTRLFKEMLENA